MLEIVTDFDRYQDAELVRKPLGKQIAHALRRDILFGRLPPNTPLQQQQLCDRFNTSRMPVRDALRELAFEGLIVRVGQRQFSVAPISRRDLEDVYLVEGTLHGLATHRLVEDISEDEANALQDLHEAMIEAGRRGETALWSKINWDFHRSINLASGSAKIRAAIRVLALSIPLEYVIEIPDWIEVANSEHELLLRAVRDRDPAEAEKLMVEHVREAGANLIVYLERQGLKLS